MNLAAELERVIADSAIADEAANAVRRLLDEAQREVVRMATQVQARETELFAAKTKIDALVMELAHLKRMRFGTRSEALGTETKDLFQETIEADIAAAKLELERRQAEAGEQPKPPRAPRERAGRQPLPAHLPRIEHRHEPETCTCGQCGKDLVLIGEDVSEQLDVEPAKFFVHRHIRPQYACRSCETVTAASIPPAVIDGGMAATGLLAWVIIGKYLDHLPLYRLEGIAAREGVTLSRSTLAEWVGRMGVALDPLAQRLAELLRQRSILHADETPVRQLDPGNGKTHRAYLWAYRSNDLDTGPPIVVFDYQSSRSGAHARSFLASWQGSLMVDDFGGYKAIFTQGVTELACLAHARRKFFDLNAAQPNAIAQEALARIAALYEIEQRGRPMSIAERATLRQSEAAPLLHSLHAWLKATRLVVAHGGGTARAIDYSLKRWPALSRYVTDGALPIDNNPVENAIRPVCLGKKNWLFTGSERAGKRAAAIQSLLATAKLNGLDPAAWLRDTLEKLPTCFNRDIDSLLPIARVSS
ncbi:MAG: transposase [Pseudomonadota bacterium]|nr:transposase [Pseudomonadota bacterium]MDQ1316216.1 transposase [Pseudomonadota bacterium]